MTGEKKPKRDLSPERMREIAETGAKQARERVQSARDAERSKKRDSLLTDKQLTLWADAVRGAPNELVRSALFSARNRSQKRLDLKGAEIAVIGDGRMLYTGEELRQDDETVWLQLIHLARESGLAQPFEFTPYAFCRSVGWPITGQSYERLDKCLTRLQATSLKVRSQRLGEEVSLSMLPGYKSKRRKDGEGGLWTVRMHEELVFLFSDFQYTRLEWEQRLALPEGLATWLHAYYASHREPYAVKIETLAIGAGLMSEDSPEEGSEERKERIRDVKKLIIKALTTLKEAGFLREFEVSRAGLVKVSRTGGDA